MSRIVLLLLDWLLVWKVVNALCNKLSFETIFSAGRCVPNPQELRVHLLTSNNFIGGGGKYYLATFVVEVICLEK